MTGMVSRIVFFVVSMTSTVSVWSSTTYRSDWDAFSVILVGWPFTRIRAVTAGAPPRSTTTISRSRMLETYAVALDPLPFIATQNGYSPPGMPAASALLLPGRRSSSATFHQ